MSTCTPGRGWQSGLLGRSRQEGRLALALPANTLLGSGGPVRAEWEVTWQSCLHPLAQAPSIECRRHLLVSLS